MADIQHENRLGNMAGGTFGGSPMAHRRTGIGQTRSTLLVLSLICGLILVPQLAVAAAKLTAASSRVNHAGQGFEVALPLTGGSGIECRDVTGGVSVALTFSEPVSSAEIGIAAGKATIAGTPIFGGNTVYVTLTRRRRRTGRHAQCEQDHGPRRRRG